MTGSTGTATKPAKTNRIERVRLDTITIDGRVQRGLDMKRVDGIADEFEWAAFGVPTLSHRVDDTVIAVDGQHRIMGAKKAGHGDRSPQCKVHYGLSLEDEARLFRLLNNTRKPMPVDLFRIAVVEGEPAAVAMNKMVEHAGMYVAASGERAFRAVAALRAVFEVGPDDAGQIAAQRTLDVLTRAWGSSANSVPAALVAGVGRVMLRYDEQVNVERLASRLSKFGGGASAFLGAARGLSKIRSVSVPDAVADITVTNYNKIPRGNKLADWTVVG